MTDLDSSTITRRDAAVLRAVIEHGYLGEGLPLSVVGVGCCGVCTGHSPSWDGHDYGCREWVRSKLAALLDAAQAVQKLRERAEFEIADAKAGAVFAGEIDNGMMLVAEDARRFAWSDIARLLDGPHAG